MSNEASTVIEDLDRAIRNMNDSIEQSVVAPDASLSERELKRRRRQQRRTTRHLCVGLSNFADCDPLWESFYDELPNYEGVNAMFAPVCSVLQDQHARLLAKLGYRHRPPPTPIELISTTRNVVLAQNGLSKWSMEHIDAARGALDNYAAQVWQRLFKNPRNPIDLLLDARKMTVGVVLLAALSHTEVETGDEFDVNIGASLKDGLKVTVTIGSVADVLPAALGNYALVAMNDALQGVKSPPRIAPDGLASIQSEANKLFPSPAQDPAARVEPPATYGRAREPGSPGAVDNSSQTVQDNPARTRVNPSSI